MLHLLVCAALGFPSGPRPAHPAALSDTATLAVTTDRSSRTVTLSVGPFRLPDMSGGTSHETDHGASHNTPVYRFEWPVAGWFRAYAVEVTDSAGRRLPREIVHHMIMVNFGRRQLVYPAAERLFGIGAETGDASVPATVGIPLEPGTPLGVYVAWHNETGEDLSGVSLTIRMSYAPANQMPRPLSALPVYFDASLTVGAGNAFDLPPGRSERAFEFELPLGGRLLGAGGHLHDYGVEVRLEDAATGRVLTTLRGITDSAGRILQVERKLFGVLGRGLRLERGRRYRVVGVYDNPHEHTLVNGGMAHMVGLFAPFSMDEWPAVTARDPEYQRDLETLARQGAAPLH